MGNELMSSAPRGIEVREEFGAIQQSNHGDTAMAAVQAREYAMVQARFVMAERHPRDWDVNALVAGGFQVVAAEVTGNPLKVKTAEQGYPDA